MSPKQNSSLITPVQTSGKVYKKLKKKSNVHDKRKRIVRRRRKSDGGRGEGGEEGQG